MTDADKLDRIARALTGRCLGLLDREALELTVIGILGNRDPYDIKPAAGDQVGRQIAGVFS